MKKDNLKNGIAVIGFLIILIFVVTTFCLIFCSKKNATFEPSSSLSEVEQLITEEETIVTTTETSNDVSTKTTTIIEESTTATPVEETTIIETTIETSQEQSLATSQESTSTSVATTTESVSSSTTVLPQAVPATVLRKSVEEIAKEVWKGLWGAGQVRKAKLEAAGYIYKEVQKKVSELGKQYQVGLSASTTIIIKKNTNTVAATSNSTKKNGYQPTQSEILLLQKLVQNEYGADWVSVYDKACIVASIMCQVKDNRFPNTITSCIYRSCVPFGFNPNRAIKITNSVKQAVSYYFNNQNTVFANWNCNSWYGDGRRNHFYRT